MTSKSNAWAIKMPQQVKDLAAAWQLSLILGCYTVEDSSELLEGTNNFSLLCSEPEAWQLSKLSIQIPYYPEGEQFGSTF